MKKIGARGPYKKKEIEGDEKMSLEDKKMVGFDPIGIHPVAYGFDKDGCVLRIEDVREAVNELRIKLKKEIESGNKLIENCKMDDKSKQFILGGINSLNITLKIIDKEFGFKEVKKK